MSNPETNPKPIGRQLPAAMRPQVAGVCKGQLIIHMCVSAPAGNTAHVLNELVSRQLQDIPSRLNELVAGPQVHTNTHRWQCLAHPQHL